LHTSELWCYQELHSTLSSKGLEGFFLKLRNATSNNMPLSLKANHTSFNLSTPSMDAKKKTPEEFISKHEHKCKKLYKA
jgi:hypothetical protein